MGEVEVTIDYTYDSLYRLTAVDYDDGTYFHYTYDAVGNRLTEETNEATSSYTYDAANRLTDVDGVAYTWDANGNLLADGTSTYTYDAANRLVELEQGDDTYAYTYNGLGDRLSQTINGETINYTLDIDTYLTEVLQDGDSTYLYGLGRIGEDRGETTFYHLPDALGSVRQLADSESQILRAQSYEPFGDVLETYGADGSTYGFTGQMVDENGLVYLRARYYDTGTGRFFTKDPWNGSPNQPMSYDPYLYAYNNPIVYTDPSGMFCIGGINFGSGRCSVDYLDDINDLIESWGNLLSDPEFQRGFIDETIDTLLVIPGIANSVLERVSTNPLLVIVPLSISQSIVNEVFPECGNENMSVVLEDLYTLQNAMQNRSIRFQQGRIVARVIMFGIAGTVEGIGALGAIVGGGATLFTAVVPGVGTVTLSFAAAAADAATYSSVVLTGIIIREAVDHLILNAITGKTGGGGENTISSPKPNSPTSLSEIVDDPYLLAGKDASYLPELEAMAEEEGWEIGKLLDGAHAGQGYTFREIHANENPTGRVIFFHPGGGHHGPLAYWKVSSPELGIIHIYINQ